MRDAAYLVGIGVLVIGYIALGLGVAVVHAFRMLTQ